jgi:hypothetical protein
MNGSYVIVLTGAGAAIASGRSARAVSWVTVQGARFKGKLGMSVRRSIKAALGARPIEPVIEAMPAEVRWFLAERFIATQWYPLKGADVMLETVARVLGRDPVDFARQIGRDAAVLSTGRVGETIISLFGTPQRLARYLGPMWEQLYDGGLILADYEEATGLLTIRRSRWVAHAPLVCITLLGSTEAVAGQMGKPRLLSAARTSCVGDGAARCQFELRFER